MRTWLTHSLCYRSSCLLAILGSFDGQRFSGVNNESKLEHWFLRMKPRGTYIFLMELTTARVNGDELGGKDADMAENKRVATRLINNQSKYG